MGKDTKICLSWTFLTELHINFLPRSIASSHLSGLFCARFCSSVGTDKDLALTHDRISSLFSSLFLDRFPQMLSDLTGGSAPAHTAPDQNVPMPDASLGSTVHDLCSGEQAEAMSGPLQEILAFIPCRNLCQCLLVNRALREAVSCFLSTLVVSPEHDQGWTGIVKICPADDV